MVVKTPEPKPLTAAEERRRTRYEEIHRRAAAGEPLRSIGRAMGLSRGKVTKYWSAQIVPERAKRRRTVQNTDAYLPYLKRRWPEGCHNARQLFDEIVTMGYEGCASQLRHLVKFWREAPITEPKPTILKNKEPPAPIRRDLRWSILCPREQLSETELGLLTDLLALHPALALGYELVQWFRRILAQRKDTELVDWLSAAASSGLSPFKGLASSIQADYPAVLAATQYNWSTDPIEGYITRVKMIKRLGYGRIRLHLLRARVTAIW